MGERDADHGLPHESSEGLEGADTWGGSGGVDRVFDLGKFLSCREDLDEIGWFWERERGRRLIWWEDGDTGDCVQQRER